MTTRGARFHCGGLMMFGLIAPAAFGQFELYQVDGNVEHPVAAVLSLGSVYPAEAATTHFRLRNTSPAPAPLSFLTAKGTGFSLTGVPAMPAGLASQQAIEFSVVFRANAVGQYSAALDSEGIAVILTAAVLPGLTYQVDGATLSPAGLNFGATETQTSTTRRLTVTNLTAMPILAPPVAVQGAGFAFGATPPTGVVFQPLDMASFDVQFQPSGVGTWTGALTIGDRTYPLAGTAIGPPLPRPALTVEQGSVSINLDSAARTAGAGTLTLEFQALAKGATDPAIQLGVVGRWLPFTIAPGDTQVHFGDLTAIALQSGTTAGTITLTVELGGFTDRKTVVIPPSPVGITSVQGVKTAGSIELRVSGFDNTRTAGAVTYRFFDASDAPLPSIRVDNSADFAAFFAASDAGGAFALRAVFPITGDMSKLAAFEVEFQNSAGTASTGRLKL